MVSGTGLSGSCRALGWSPSPAFICLSAPSTMKVYGILLLFCLLASLGLLTVLLGQYKEMNMIMEKRRSLDALALDQQRVVEYDAGFRRSLEALVAQGEETAKDLEGSVASFNLEQKTAEKDNCLEETVKRRRPGPSGDCLCVGWVYLKGQTKLEGFAFPVLEHHSSGEQTKALARHNWLLWNNLLWIIGLFISYFILMAQKFSSTPPVRLLDPLLLIFFTRFAQSFSTFLFFPSNWTDPRNIFHVILSSSGSFSISAELHFQKNQQGFTEHRRVWTENRINVSFWSESWG